MSAHRPLLWPLVPLYALGLRMKEQRRPKAKRLQHPVISVGSISAGGAGKTPVTLLLLELLQHRGYSPVVLSRGYKRQGTGIARVNAEGDAAEFGDEPLLLARRGGVPVYVGADRHGAGSLAEEWAEEGTVFVLDDGFQHRGLARDVDIVLLTKRDAADALLPAGNLREPLQTLRRADVLVLREDEAPKLLPQIKKWTDAARPPAIWLVRRSLSFAHGVPKQPLAFCGIARPEGFMAMLRAAGCRPAGQIFFGDHHAFTARDLHWLIARAQKVGGTSLTTEKDLVRLGKAMSAKLEYFFPIAAPRLMLELVDESAAMQALLERMRERRQTGPA